MVEKKSVPEMRAMTRRFRSWAAVVKESKEPRSAVPMSTRLGRTSTTRKPSDAACSKMIPAVSRSAAPSSGKGAS